MSGLFPLRILLMALLISFPVTQLAQEKMEGHSSGHIMIIPTDLNWVEGPPSLPKGVKVAVLEGDMSKPGPFTVRAKVPANYTIPPHTHPAVEHVTVLSGSAFMGMGTEVDESKATKLPVGGFVAIEPGTTHFFFTKEASEIQLHGVGPWGITYVNPTDDPRNVTSK